MCVSIHYINAPPNRPFLFCGDRTMKPRLKLPSEQGTFLLLIFATAPWDPIGSMVSMENAIYQWIARWPGVLPASKADANRIQ